jgi:uncharacterized protein YjhX (UPF0386 family)
MVNEPFNTLPGSSALPPDKTGVTICIEEFTFNGKIHHMPQQRILDALNRGIVAGQPRASKDFVRITEADVYNRDGKKSSNRS